MLEILHQRGAQCNRPVLVYSSNLLAPFAESPVTHVTCQSSALGPALTARPTFICMMDTLATALKATATTASARLMNNNASHCGEQVNQWLLITHAVSKLSYKGIPRLILLIVFACLVCLCVQEQSLRRVSALRESTRQGILTGTAGRTPKAPLPNVMQGKTLQLH